ncbi:hypothetical protein ES703_106564 [subsurface metagenome]
MLANPQLISAEIQRQSEAQRNQTSNDHSIDKQIARSKRQLRNYDYQEKRLIGLFRYGEIDEDKLLDELNTLKKDRSLDQEQLTNLRKSKEQLASLAKMEIKFNEFCDRVQQNLSLCDHQQKRLALDALDIRVTATQEDIDIRAAIPIELTPMPSSEEFITTGQTWA